MKTAVVTIFLMGLSIVASSQKVAAKLQFQQGQVLQVSMEMKTTVSQEAAGNAIDFTANADAVHTFRVTNATDNNSTLHHDVKKIAFTFNGMGQKKSVNSDNPKDLEDAFGKPLKNMLNKSYDMIIDPAGKTLMAKPEKIEVVMGDDRLGIVFNLLKDVTNIVYPPKKNEPSFFKVLPESETGLNESWTETGTDSTGLFKTVYTLSAITDSTVIVDFKGNSSVVRKNEMMGFQTSTSMNNAYTGKIILDKATGILREKTIATTSTGSTEAMGGTMPVSSKTTMTIRVNPQEQASKK